MCRSPESAPALHCCPGCQTTFAAMKYTVSPSSHSSAACSTNCICANTARRHVVVQCLRCTGIAVLGSLASWGNAWCLFIFYCLLCNRRYLPAMAMCGACFVVHCLLCIRKRCQLWQYVVPVFLFIAWCFLVVYCLLCTTNVASCGNAWCQFIVRCLLCTRKHCQLWQCVVPLLFIACSPMGTSPAVMVCYAGLALYHSVPLVQWL